MTVASSRKLKEEFYEGRDLWYEYVRVNGYAFEPNNKGLKVLSKLLDLKVSYIRKRIHGYLSA